MRPGRAQGAFGGTREYPILLAEIDIFDGVGSDESLRCGAGFLRVARSAVEDQIGRILKADHRRLLLSGGDRAVNLTRWDEGALTGFKKAQGIALAKVDFRRRAPESCRPSSRGRVGRTRPRAWKPIGLEWSSSRRIRDERYAAT